MGSSAGGGVGGDSGGGDSGLGFDNFDDDSPTINDIVSVASDSQSKALETGSDQAIQQASQAVSGDTVAEEASKVIDSGLPDKPSAGVLGRRKSLLTDDDLQLSFTTLLGG